MKKQKFELAHDIIAEKIWERLPEQDKQLRMIQASIRQRQEDYAAGKGSLLGKAELEGWAVFLPLLEMTGEERDYVHASKQKEKRDRRKRLYVLLGILGLILISGLVSGVLMDQANDAEKRATTERTKADSVILVSEKIKLELDNKQLELDNKEIELEEKTRTAESASARADSMTKQAEEARILASLEKGNAEEAIRRAEKIQLQADSAQKAANLAISDQKVAEAEFAFQAQKTQKAFRLVQLALEKNPDNAKATSLQEAYLRYLGLIEVEEVIHVKVAPDSRHLACLVQRKDSVVCQVFALEGEGRFKRVLVSPALAFTHRIIKNNKGVDQSIDQYNESFRFVGPGGSIACLIHQEERVTCQIFTPQGDQQYKRVFTSPPIEQSDRYGYQGSYQFTEGGQYLACLIRPEGGAVTCQLFVLEKDQSYQKLPLSPPLAPSDKYGSYDHSYRFASDGRHIAMLTQQDGGIRSIVFELEGDQKYQERVRSSPLEYADSYLNSYKDSYCFGPKGKHIAFLVRQEQGLKCEVFALDGEREYRNVLLSQLLAESSKRSDDSYTYRDSYKFSGGEEHLALLVQNNRAVDLHVYALKGPQKYSEVLLPPMMLAESSSYQTGRNYSASFHFVKDGGYIACLIRQNDSIRCQVLVIDKDPKFEKVILSAPLAPEYGNYYVHFSEYGEYIAFTIQHTGAKRYQIFSLQKNENYRQLLISDPGAVGSYKFSKGRKCIAYLMRQNEQVNCHISSLEVRTKKLGTTIIKSDYSSYTAIYEPYRNSFRFDSTGKYLAFLTSNDQGILCRVGAITADLNYQEVCSSSPLAKRSKDPQNTVFSYEDSYRFSNEGKYITFLNQKGGKEVLTVHALEKENQREFEAPKSIGSDYSFIPNSDFLVYLTTDNHLRVVNVSIPQEDLISYYDKILPSLEELEKRAQ